MLPKIGVNLSPLAPSLLVEGAQMAEALGFESVWLGEHVAVPANFEELYDDPQRPFTVDSPFLDPLVALAHIAGATTTIRLGTGVVLLPLRHIVQAARAIVTVDVLSKGRLDFGVGVGWMKEEYDILGRDFHRRGRRLDEMLAALTVLYRDTRPEFHGTYVDFPAIGFEPKPFNGRPRTFVGGYDQRARQRAVHFDGWYGSVRWGEIRDHVDALHRLRAAGGLADQPFEIAAVHLGAPEPTELGSLAEAGVDRLVVTPWQRAPGVPTGCGDATSLDELEHYARTVLS
jgi:probable F420-dependent oxidoreductase